MIRRSLPPRFEDASMELLHPSFECVKEYLLDLRPRLKAGAGLFVSGPPGVGKTYAIAALTKAAVSGIEYMSTEGKNEGKMVPLVLRDFLFATGPSLFEQYALPYDAGDKDRTTDLEAVNWLVINDLGKEFRGGAYAQQVPYKLGRLLRSRVEKRLTTHITTNLLLRRDEESQGMSIEEVYGDSIFSLLMEACPFRYEVKGPDRRHSKEE